MTISRSVGRGAMLWLAAALGATGALAQAPGSGEGLLRHDIAVETVDPAARQPANVLTHVPDRHLVLAPAAPAQRRKRLFLYIDGTTIAPTMSLDILRTGVARGYHVISLAYPNTVTVAALCRQAADDDCTGKLREEMLTGEDLSPLVSIARPDAIEARLLALLTHLAATYPDEGWGAFLKQGAVDWSLVSAAGHSQGAGHVALLAKRHDLLRAVMLSGVADVNAAGRTASWLSRPNATPPARQYGFSHVADPVVPLAVARGSWKAIGLDAFGAPQGTEGQQAPYGGSHELTSAQPLPVGVNPHLAMALDRVLPRKADGQPLYAPVWIFEALP